MKESDVENMSIELTHVRCPATHCAVRLTLCDEVENRAHLLAHHLPVPQVEAWIEDRR